MATTLKQVEALVDELAMDDQVRLMKHLAPRIKSGIEKGSSVPDKADGAWAHYKRVADQVATLPSVPKTTAEIMNDIRR